MINFTNVQMLRALAAINVVIFHSLFSANKYNMPVTLFAFLKDWGASGVDLFFVISGFIMFYIQYHKNRTCLSFFKDRLLRIAPLYWLLTCFLGLLLLISPFLFREMTFSFKWLLSSILFSSNTLMGSLPLLYVGWTLEYEMLFYLLFSISLLMKKA